MSRLEWLVVIGVSLAMIVAAEVAFRAVHRKARRIP